MRQALPLVLLILTVACGPSPATPPEPAPAVDMTPATPPAPKTWTKLASWTGTGMKQTESFTTTGREWRIVWASKTSNPASILQVMVYGGDGKLVDLVGNAQGTASDISYVRSAPGPHYLHISSANTTFSVTVEEQR